MVKNPPANAGDLRDAGVISGSGRERWPADRRRQPYQGDTRILCHTDFFFFFANSHLPHLLHGQVDSLPLNHRASQLYKFCLQLIERKQSVNFSYSPCFFFFFFFSPVFLTSSFGPQWETKTTFSIIQVAPVVKNPKCRGRNRGVAKSPPQMRSSVHTHTPLKKNPSMILSQSTGHSITID